MASTLLDSGEDEQQEGRQLGGQMSFLEHLGELRRRIIRSAVFIFVALIFCWFVSGQLYNFLAAPMRHALAEAAQRPVALQGLTGGERILMLNTLKEGDTGRFVFEQTTKLGTSVIPPGASVAARVARGPGRSAFHARRLRRAPSSEGLRLPLNFVGEVGGLPN